MGQAEGARPPRRAPQLVEGDQGLGHLVLGVELAGNAADVGLVHDLRVVDTFLTRSVKQWCLDGRKTKTQW